MGVELLLGAVAVLVEYGEGLLKRGDLLLNSTGAGQVQVVKDSGSAAANAQHDMCFSNIEHGV